MRLPRVEAALFDCERHLSSSAVAEVRIRALLTQALLILVFAEFERVIRGQVRTRCAGIADPEVARFVTSCADRVIRSFRISDLAGLLNRFDADCGKEFTDRLEPDPKARNMYDSLVRTRNGVAHGDELQATLEDVKEYYRCGHVVLDHFRAALFREPGGADETS